jgi:hypothetical protein
MRRAIWVLIMSLSGSAAAAQDCDIPPSYVNRATVLVSDTLLVSIATDKNVYSPLDTVRVYFQIVNVGEHEFIFETICYPSTSAFILPADCDSLGQPDCEALPMELEVAFCPAPPLGVGPGECYNRERSLELSCCGYTPPNGGYGVWSGLFVPCFSGVSPCGIVFPSGGIRVTMEIDSSVPLRQWSWGRIKTLYR